MCTPERFPCGESTVTYNIMAENTVLCAASAYEQKYYLNPAFEKMPESVRNELQIISVLFVEEIGLTVLERNQKAKKPVLIEFSLFYGEDSVLIIERDSGELFDITDPDTEIKGLSGFVLGGLMQAHQEKTYLLTTGYNRNMIRFSREESTGAVK